MAQAARCNKQWLPCLTCDHWPRLQGPTHRLVSGQTSKDGCKQSQGSSIHVCTIQTKHACNPRASIHVCMQSHSHWCVCSSCLTDVPTNQCSCNVHGAAQGNKGTRSLTHEPANVKEMIKHELQTSSQGLVSKVQSFL